MYKMSCANCNHLIWQASCVLVVITQQDCGNMQEIFQEIINGYVEGMERTFYGAEMNPQPL
jgi:hypothetical protein